MPSPLPLLSLQLLLLCLCPVCHSATAAVTSQVSNRLATIGSPDKLANLCLRGRHHKTSPGPEPELTGGPCAAYAGRSCCSAAVGNQLGSDDEFANAAFRLDHCGKMSPECMKWFERSRCMYECSPYLGPWLVKVTGFRWRTERVYNLPLCREQCSAWFADCRSDRTCVPNWSVDFVWKVENRSGARRAVNKCPAGAPCRTFAEIFPNGTDHFCEDVWDGEYDVVSETMPCLLLNWTAGNPDPNRELAERGSRERLAFLTRSAGGAPAPAPTLTVLTALLAGLALACCRIPDLKL